MTERTATAQQLTAMNPNSNHSNLLEQNSAIFVFNPNCVRYLKRQTYGKAVHSSENTTKIFSDFYKREQHQKSKKIAELLRPLHYDKVDDGYITTTVARVYDRLYDCRARV